MTLTATHTISSLASSAEVEQELSRVLEAQRAKSSAYGSQFVALWDRTTACVMGGKLLRPRLLLSAFDALVSHSSSTGKRPSAIATRDATVRVAAATELLHYSFLLHDDVIDNDLLRRGRPNLIGATLVERTTIPGQDLAQPHQFDAKELHWARTSAMLMGDMLLAEVHQIFAREQLAQEIRTRMLDLLQHTILESVAGEHLDVGLSDGVVTADLNTVLAMSRLKTATYTFELPLKAAAILAGANNQVEAVMGDIGRHLGVAFQLQDDMLSVFGSPTEHGKDSFSDLREGKETAIIAYARMTSAWPSIEPHFGKSDLSDADARGVRALLSACGAEQFVGSLIDDQLRACFALIGSGESGVPAELVKLFDTLAETIEHRQS